MSDNGPGCGTIQLLPDIKLSTAYVLLRPFFNDDNKLDMESTYFYGADPGQGQVCKTNWHPHLKLEKTVVSCPKADPGDYVFWHGDMVSSKLAVGPSISLRDCYRFIRLRRSITARSTRLSHSSP